MKDKYAFTRTCEICGNHIGFGSPYDHKKCSEEKKKIYKQKTSTAQKKLTENQIKRFCIYIERKK